MRHTGKTRKRVLRGGPADGRTFEDDLEGVDVTNVPGGPGVSVIDRAGEDPEFVGLWHRYVYDHTDNNDVAIFRYDGDETT